MVTERQYSDVSLAHVQVTSKYELGFKTMYNGGPYGSL